MNEFSIRAMKNIIGEYTGKRVSRDSAVELGEWLTGFGKARSRTAKIEAGNDDRQTVRDKDFRQSRSGSPRKTSTSVPNAPVERVIRSVDVGRVSESAVEELKKELLAKAEEVSLEVDRLASHAGRDTIKAEDFELARRGDL